MSRVHFRLPAFHTHLTSFLNVLDLRVGATVITLFGLFNKIAGIYGVIAIFQGGSFSQVSLYLYSLATILLFLWAIRGIADEDSFKVMRFAHLFLADHMLSTAWTLFFGLYWFIANPHNGEKPPLNEYQEGLMGLIEQIESQYEPSKNVHHEPLVGQARVEAAQRVWNGERGFSATVLVLGWLLKIYFALALYSYAIHLRHGTYRTLPLSKPSSFSIDHISNGAYAPIPEQGFELDTVDEAENDDNESPDHSNDIYDRDTTQSTVARIETNRDPFGRGQITLERSPSGDLRNTSRSEKVSTIMSGKDVAAVGASISRSQSRSASARARENEMA